MDIYNFEELKNIDSSFTYEEEEEKTPDPYILDEENDARKVLQKYMDEEWVKRLISLEGF